METFKLKWIHDWTRLQEEIFRLFCVRAGRTLNMSMVAKALDVTPTAVANALPGLEKEGLLKVEPSKTMNLVSVRFNRDSRRAVELKRVENLGMAYESGLADFLYDEFAGCAIILFGSYSRGEDTWAGETTEGRSDIDIAVIGTKAKEVDLSRFGGLLERDIHLNCFESWDKVHKNLRNNILNGIVLSGGVEL
jgi:predicted nucleotidyltransferase